MGIDKKFQDLLKYVINNGEKIYDESRKVNKLQVPSYTLRHSVEEGFPLVSLKAVNYKHIVSELVWFLNGDNTKAFLDKYKNPIWDKDIANWNGVDAGRNYGVQWRDYAGKVDQIHELIEGMKENINSTRLKVEAWNPAELKQTTLPPCHTGFQIIAYKGGFELHYAMRSQDLFLGSAFNIASYFTLGLFLERVTGIKFKGIEANLKCVHLYDNALFEAVLLANKDLKDYEIPYIEFDITKDLLNIDPDKVKVRNYYPDKFIKVEMLAPIK